jgi:hypothetical protein
MNVRLVLLPRKWMRGFRGVTADAERRSEVLITNDCGADLAIGKILGWSDLKFPCFVSAWRFVPWSPPSQPLIPNPLNTNRETRIIYEQY